MEDIFDFLCAALQWIAIGLLFAVFFTRRARLKKEEKLTADYGSEGMVLGMCLGLCLGASFGNNTGIGVALGMLIGLAIGSCIKKEDSGEGNDEK